MRLSTRLRRLGLPAAFTPQARPATVLAPADHPPKTHAYRAVRVATPYAISDEPQSSGLDFN